MNRKAQLINEIANKVHQRLLVENEDKNEYGIPCPVDWDDVPERYYYVTVNADGLVCFFERRPVIRGHNLGVWSNSHGSGKAMYKIDPPMYYGNCIWERPLRYL